MSYFFATLRLGSFVQVIDVRLSLFVIDKRRRATGSLIELLLITDMSFAMGGELRQALALFGSDSPVHERYRSRR